MDKRKVEETDLNSEVVERDVARWSTEGRKVDTEDR